ncbi:LPXTG cell wall anchor domain-containing protein [Streptomyces oryzae]|uniref:LPXTG cell wall anchor domain-containing protein n=1 Tax=Streptomyces oryzae TaxID=1434886 RepID=A0ABS3X735_9ACTN|nr:LAETG motif-containing sortase-dependent surface protein [Streptomyces oryzae]MBO8191187.1 LPXTG cell wall anchor domain-containing protein [Streptomyces oryzae]
MNRSRITSAAATVALVGGLAVTQFATAGSAFAAGGADLNSGAATGFLYNKGTGEVRGGFGINLGSYGPEATKATLTVTAVKNIHFDTKKKPTFDEDASNDKHNFTVKSVTEKQVVVTVDLAGDGDEIEKVDVPGYISGKKQTLRTSIKGDKPDPDPSNNTKTMNYSVDAPDWDPDKPTQKPTEKPTEKPTSKPSEPSQKPTSKPSKPSDDASDANTPAPNGGSDKGDSGKDGDLAETGGNSNTPLLVGGAGALVVIGGAALFLAKRKKAGQS